MTPSQFTAFSIALLRSAVGWQSAIARRLGIESRTVRRWLHDGEIPAWAADRMAELIGLADAAGPWPRDEWIIGDGPPNGDGHRREFIIHTVPPRFIARVVAVDDAGEIMPNETPADVITGVVFSSDSFLLCEIDWLDRPDPGAVTLLLESAADAIPRA